ncbi:MAG: carboxypeptidase regulatory-like domain-containing protein [Polyangiaceae bacterium]|nr:carboxypeptidase regulatory-like domain-containing protein [Polyangiaceae bacterium]
MPVGSAPSPRGPASRPSSPRFGLLAIAPLAIVPAGALVFFALPGPAPKAPAPSATEAPALLAPARGLVIGGRVVEAEGRSVAGARVWLVAAEAPFNRSAERYSDASGTFSFADVAPGSYRVAAEHLHYGSALSAPIAPAEASEAGSLVLALDAVRSVGGRVLNVDGDPVVGAKISAEGATGSAPSAASSADGSFWFDNLPRAASGLRVSARGYVTEVVMLQTAAAAERQSITVRLHAAPDIVGLVLDPSGRPLAATVTACEEGPDRKVARSGADGAFRVPASASGCAFLAEHDSFAPSPSTHAEPGDQVVLRLGPGGALEGRVVDEAGAPVRSFWLAFEPRPGPGGLPKTQPARLVDDHGGHFAFASLAPGAYTLAVRAEGFAPTLVPTVDLGPGARRSDLLVKLTRGGVIEGRVLDEARQAPLAGVKVALETPASSFSLPPEAPPTVTTDANGYYRIENVPQTGPVSVRAERPGGGTSLFGGLDLGAQSSSSGALPLLTYNLGLAALAASQVRYNGIGVRLTQGKRAVEVDDVFEKSPADRAGVEEDDEIIAVDMRDVERSALADVVQRMRGQPNTDVRLRLRRPGQLLPIELVIKRKLIEQPLTAVPSAG